MSIHGIGGSNIQGPGARIPVRDNGQAPIQRQPARGMPGSPAQVPPGTGNRGAAAAGGTHSVPAEPPPGTDPALWSVLSNEERAFFAKAGAMGPLTYGRMLQEMKTAQLPVSRGGRLDVKI